MSQKGNPFDNAVCESFFRTLKRELVKGAAFEMYYIMLSRTSFPAIHALWH
jgi:transposase InsO family protein